MGNCSAAAAGGSGCPVSKGAIAHRSGLVGYGLHICKALFGCGMVSGKTGILNRRFWFKATIHQKVNRYGKTPQNW